MNLGFASINRDQAIAVATNIVYFALATFLHWNFADVFLSFLIEVAVISVFWAVLKKEPDVSKPAFGSLSDYPERVGQARGIKYILGSKAAAFFLMVPFLILVVADSVLSLFGRPRIIPFISLGWAGLVSIFILAIAASYTLSESVAPVKKIGRALIYRLLILLFFVSGIAAIGDLGPLALFFAYYAANICVTFDQYSEKDTEPEDELHEDGEMSVAIPANLLEKK